MDAFTPEQFAQMHHDAMQGLSTEQFDQMSDAAIEALTRDNMGGFDPATIQGMSADVLQQFDPAEFREMPDHDFAKMMANFDPSLFTPEDLANFVPPDWTLDPATGELIAPEGAGLAFPPVDGLQLNEGVGLPEIPDFSKGLAIGGVDSRGSVLDGLDSALDAANLPDFEFQQDGGILMVVGTNDRVGTNLAFIPDADGITQAPAGTEPGISVDSQGRYILTTPEGYQIPIIPAPADPNEILDIIPGGSVTLGDDGETRIQEAGEDPLMGVFKPFITDSDLAPGMHHEGSGVDEIITVVYEDGTSQQMRPTIQSPEDFVETGEKINGVDSLQVNTDGSIDMVYKGVELTLQPTFNIDEGADGEHVPPSIVINSQGGFDFINEDGDTQTFFIEN